MEYNQSCPLKLSSIHSSYIRSRCKHNQENVRCDRCALQLCVQSWKETICHVQHKVTATRRKCFISIKQHIVALLSSRPPPPDQYTGQRTPLNLQHATVLNKSIHVTLSIKLRKRGQSARFANKQKDMCSRWWRQTDLQTLAPLTFKSRWSMGTWILETRRHASDHTWISQCNDISCGAVQGLGSLIVPIKQHAVLIDGAQRSYHFYFFFWLMHKRVTDIGILLLNQSKSQSDQCLLEWPSALLSGKSIDFLQGEMLLMNECANCLLIVYSLKHDSCFYGYV